jgi:hypothetical protein
MADEAKHAWDSSPEWTAARERTRADVQAAFAPRPQTCPSCGRVEATAARDCPHCGASYVVVQPKLSRRVKLWIAAGVAVLAAIGVVVWLLVSPSINHLKKTAAERDAAQQAAFVRRETKRLTAEQRLHRGRAADRQASPAALVTGLTTAIDADARSRVQRGLLRYPVLHVDCTPVGLGPLVANAVRGGYECVAVTASIKPGAQIGGKIGYPFWAIVDYRRRTFAWCKINPRPGEHAISSKEPIVNPPAGCDLRI